jgi:parvulin-like peptidyl-prolyl isomerase
MKTAAAILGVFVLVASASVAGQGVILEQVLVKVNGEIFTKTELEQKQIQELRLQKMTVNTAADLQTDAALRKALIEITPEVVVAAVDELLLIQRGKELGLTPGPEQIKDTVERIKKQNNIATDEQFKQALAQSGFPSFEDFQKETARQYIIARVQQQEIMQRIQLTEEEAREYYKKHLKDFEKPPTISIREIFLPLPTVMQDGKPMVNVAAADEVSKKMADVRARLVKGEDFAKLVAEVSESPSKANGGLIGPINISELAPQVRELLEKMKPGDISEPLSSPSGYQLIKLETRTEATPEKFDAVRDEIANRIGSERLEGEQKKYIAKLRAQAIIEWKNQELRKMYDEKIGQPKVGGGR